MMQNNQIGGNNQYQYQAAVDGSLINLAGSNGTALKSPHNADNSSAGNMMIPNNGKVQNIITDSSHGHSQSDAVLTQKRLRSQQNYIGNMSTQAALNVIAANQAQH